MIINKEYKERKVFHVVFMVANIINDKVYVGKTSQPTLSNSYYGSGAEIKKALIKYSRHHFTKTILKICDSKKEQEYYEDYFIKKYESFKSQKGYNRRKGSTGGIGVRGRVPHNKIDISAMVGKRYGKLIVLYEAQPVVKKNLKLIRKLMCQCDCGNKKSIVLSSVKNGITNSCGCLIGESAKERLTLKYPSLRLLYPLEYTAWNGMKSRCNPSNIDKVKKHYSDKGVEVCERWAKSFKEFLEDMGTKPSPEHSLDRIDNNNLGYCKENCRWATTTQQARNKTDNALYTYNGETKCIADWAEQYGIRRDTLRFRLVESGWDIETCLTKLVKDIKKPVYHIETGTVYKSPYFAAKELGINYGLVKYHLNKRKINETPLRYVEK
jgi:hypothetical protein